MVTKLQDGKVAEPFFRDRQSGILQSCLQNVMGSIYVDDIKSPRSAMAILNDFCFFSGVPNRELVLYKPKEHEKNFMIMTPINQGWAELIEECYSGRMKEITRYEMKKVSPFDEKQLKSAVDMLNPEYTLRNIDEELYHLCKSLEWSRDLVSSYNSYEEYQKLGLGVVVLKKEQIVSGASAYSRYLGGIEIEVDTKEEYQRKNLAYACGAQLILECLRKKLYPYWDAHNLQSVGLAEKLGYTYKQSYQAYEIWNY